MLGNIQSTQYSGGASATSKVSGSEFSRSVSSVAPTSSSGNISSILNEIRSELKNIDKLLQQLVSQLGGDKGGRGGQGDCGCGSTTQAERSTGQADAGAAIKGLQDELNTIQTTLSQIGEQQGSGRGQGQNGVYGGQQSGYHQPPCTIDQPPVYGTGRNSDPILPIYTAPVPGRGECPPPVHPQPCPPHIPVDPKPPICIDPKPPVVTKPPVDCPKPPIDTKPPVIDCPKPPVDVCPAPKPPKPPIDVCPAPKPPKPPIDVCPAPKPKPDCGDDKWSVGEVKNGKGEIKLGKDYTVTFDESKEEFVVKNNCTGDTTRVWGDPHVDVKNDGKTDWDFKKDSTFQLKDGTKITVGTVNEEGKKATENDRVSYSSKLTITKHDKAITVTGLAGNHDGKDNVKVTTSGHGKQIDKATDDGVTVKEKKGGWDLNGKTVTQGDVDKAEKGAKAH